jgi:hypothetical protein
MCSAQQDVEWGLIMLMGGQEKAPCCTSHYHTTSYTLCSARAYSTLGDGYKMPCNDALLAEGFVAEGLHGNRFSFKNADAAAACDVSVLPVSSSPDRSARERRSPQRWARQLQAPWPRE